ncbi:probable thiopurine S-methyltransferase [Ptychodera flava]|uniref:probable thiopurine S-methyltransferase n=1 Tax=Ptychodera flava TaxID=63121 RepID=UPI00396A4108
MAEIAKENGVVQNGSENIQGKSVENGIQEVKQKSSEVAQGKDMDNGVKEVEEKPSRTGKKRKNQFGDYDESYMSVDSWRKRWKKGQTRFHMPKVHPMLEKNFEWLTKGEKKQRVFLPLCGKSLDLNWLAEKEQIVIGNECSAEGCEQFFKENELEFTKESLKDTVGDVYKAKDKDITIYCCDYFKLTEDVIGTFDCIWDRGALAAIDPQDRTRYAKVITPLLRKGGRYLLDLFQLDHESFVGPPYDCKPTDVDDMFGKYFNIDRVVTRDALSAWQREWGVKYFIQDVYHFTPKVTEEITKCACSK